MRDFIITFGFDYAEIPHPNFPLAHPDGYVRITGLDQEAARLFAANMFGPGLWAGIYAATPERMARFSRGAVMTVVVPVEVAA